MHVHAGLHVGVRSVSRLIFKVGILIVRNLAVVRNKRDGCTYMSIEEMMVTEIQPINFEWTNLQQQGEILQLNKDGMGLDFVLSMNYLTL